MCLLLGFENGGDGKQYKFEATQNKKMYTK